MSRAFFDELSCLVAREVNAARKTHDDDRLSAAVADLAMLLGKVIAITCGGDSVLIDKMLTSADGVIIESATETGEMVAGIKRLVQGGKPK